MPELSKTYDFKVLEPYWYDQWLSKDAFKPVVAPKNLFGKKQETYTILMPPLNVTGIMHMGHFLCYTLQDVLIRRARLEGKAARWDPGTDHAGLATQIQVERALRKEGKTKNDMSREEFLQRILKWCEENGGTIFKQFKRAGYSCDWSRKVYTMDPDYHRAVLYAFVELYKKGLIYRDYRMVNWDPKSQTGLSDEEVIMKEIDGVMVRMKYDVVESPGEFIEIETTRPETLMGDTAVAVNPKHPKYAKYIGKHVWRPFPRAQIPVIADDAADLSFGTGALKVTPAHDKVDFDIGKRHQLPIIDVFNPDATLNEKAGAPFTGLSREKARDLAIEELKKLGLLIEVKKYTHAVGHSERADVPIEPRLSTQWWMRHPHAKETLDAVQSGKIKFYPERWVKVLANWINNIQDWCISRQVIWGQRIPVWYKKGADRNDPKNRHCSVDGPADPENWEQEPDVLDTWASSWIWNLAVFGWPDKKKMKENGFNEFYPTNTLVTAPEIIFLWVARMVMSGLEFIEGPQAKRLPFTSVYFNGTVRAKDGRKMSKSLGNGVDPMELFEKYGADGSRFGLIRNAATGQDICFDEEMTELGRNFCTKLWNAARFRQMQGETAAEKSFESLLKQINPNQMDAYDHWILTRLVETTRLVEKCFAEFEFAPMAQGLYAFFWGDFCDWYVEATKARLKDEAQKSHILALQDIVLRQTLQLLEPIIPHITEELWKQMGFAVGGSLIQESKILSAKELERLFKKIGVDAKKAAFVGQLAEFVEAGRQLKADAGMASRRDLEFSLKTSDAKILGQLETQREVLERFLGAKKLSLISADVQNAPARVTPLGTLYLELASAITAEDKTKLQKQLEEIEKAIASAENKLNNPTFTGKAPANVIEGVRTTMEQNKKKVEELKKLLG
jgi:valyl-tRNA synthetase